MRSSALGLALVLWLGGCSSHYHQSPRSYPSSRPEQAVQWKRQRHERDEREREAARRAEWERRQHQHSHQRGRGHANHDHDRDHNRGGVPHGGGQEKSIHVTGRTPESRAEDRGRAPARRPDVARSVPSSAERHAPVGPAAPPPAVSRPAPSPEDSHVRARSPNERRASPANRAGSPGERGSSDKGSAPSPRLHRSRAEGQ